MSIEKLDTNAEQYAYDLRHAMTPAEVAVDCTRQALALDGPGQACLAALLQHAGTLISELDATLEMARDRELMQRRRNMSAVSASEE